jgi:hypothetical protein
LAARTYRESRNGRHMRFVLGIVLLMVLGAARAWGVDFGQEGFFVVSTPRGENGQFGGRLYAGNVMGRFDGEQIQLMCLWRGSDQITYNPQVDGPFRQWTDRRANDIARILFPSDLEGAAQGVPGGIAGALDAFDILVTPGIGFAGLAGLGLDLPARNQTLSLGEFERFRADGLDGTVLKLTPGHEFRTGAIELGFSTPLRYSTLSDGNGTTSKSAGLNLHAKYHHYIYPEWQLIPIAGAGARVFAMDSRESETFGDVRYGGHVGLATTFELERAVVGGGVLYSISDADLPGALTPDDISESIIDSVTARPADQQITFGAKVAFQLPRRFLGTLFGRYVQTVGASAVDEDLKAVTVFGGSVLYFPADWVGLELGYKQLFATAGLRSSAAFLQGVIFF